MAAQATDAITVLGPEASFKGELTLRGAAKILGEFDGSITAAGEVHVGASSVCQATIEADSILVDGTVNGDLIARERLQLTNKARVQGDVSAAALIVAEGASFVGRCAVGPEALNNRTERMTSERTTGERTTERTERATETKPMRLRATGTAPEYAQPQPEWNNAAIPAKPAWMANQMGTQIGAGQMGNQE